MCIRDREWRDLFDWRRKTNFNIKKGRRRRRLFTRHNQDGLLSDRLIDNPHTYTRLPQSSSLFISGSGSWPLRSLARFFPTKTKKICASRLALVKKMSSTCLPSHQLLKASGPRKHPVQDACGIVCPVFFIHFHKKHKTQKTKLCPVQAARTQSCVLRESCDKPLKMFASIK